MLWAKSSKVFTGFGKTCKMLEVEPKKQVFASHGDFRGYLYEAPIFPMPEHKGKLQKGWNKGILAFQVRIEVLNYRLHRKNLANYETLLFRRKTPTDTAICDKISSKTAYFSKMRQTIKRFLRTMQHAKNFVNLKFFFLKTADLTEVSAKLSLRWRGSQR